MNQLTSVERVNLPDLPVGPLEVKHPPVVAVDLTSIEVRLGVSLDAIIGLDLLGRQDFTIDYTEHTIRLGTPSANGQAIPFELRTQAGAPYVVIPMRVNSHPLWVLFDTGTDGLTLFASFQEPRLPRLKKVGTPLAVTARGAITSQLVEVSNLRFGTKEWGNLQATVVAAPPAREFDGMLGPASLRVKRMAFSFASNTLYLEFSR